MIYLFTHWSVTDQWAKRFMPAWPFSQIIYENGHAGINFFETYFFRGKGLNFTKIFVVLCFLKPNHYCISQGLIDYHAASMFVAAWHWLVTKPLPEEIMIMLSDTNVHQQANNCGFLVNGIVAYSFHLKQWVELVNISISVKQWLVV